MLTIIDVQHQGCAHIAPIVLSRDRQTKLFFDIQFGRVAPGDGIVNTVVQFIFGGRLPVFQSIERANELIAGVVLDTHPYISFFFFRHVRLQ
jgi:hypothetical protein